MKKLFTLLSSLLLFAGIALAQPGALDTTFNRAFKFTGITTGVGFRLSKMLFQPDGKIIIGGAFYTDNTNNYKTILRLYRDGSIDESFDVAAINAPDGNIPAMALLANGKILVVNNNSSIVRLNTDGSLDPGFTTDLPSIHTSFITQITEQPDGKILISGFSFNNAVAGIVRLNIDGSIDQSFVSPEIFPFADRVVGSAFALQPDGKIVTVNTITISTSPVTYTGKLNRLNTDGTLDNSFNVTDLNPTPGAPEASSIILQPDGKIVVAGSFTVSSGGVPTDYNIARFNPDGSQDNTFHAGIAANNFTERIALQSDGKILVGGFYLVVLLLA